MVAAVGVAAVIVSMTVARNGLGALVREVAGGGEVIITRRGGGEAGSG